LTEDRPYRKRMPLASVRRIMDNLVKDGKIHGRCMEALFDRGQEAEAIIRENKEN